MKVIFTEEAYRQFQGWVKAGDTKTLARIRQLLEAIEKSPYGGIGKPEPLKYDLAGTWSRRINQKDRLRYKVEKEAVIVLSCKEHY